ncbi:MAG: LysM peptidoglycan-binding domain-containing protein [Prevotella sp.]|jgi:LysM repeat protein|nr:LysM peptidoglycan-binding domain-containing protein [Prevotella sp.]
MFREFIIICFFFLSLLTSAGNIPDKQPVRVNTVTDKHIEVPPDIDYNLENRLVEWKRRLLPQEPCPQTENGDASCPDSVYINRLYAFPSEMELSYNPVVREYIERYTSRYRLSVQYMLGKGKYYFPMIEDIFGKYALPMELKYLTVIESALNPTAISRAGAAGLWQFMPSTGKMYDLEVNSLVDERFDPVKATEAAARHLKDLYETYEDWNLVIAAYNCGTGSVQKAMRRSGGLKDYWEIYPFLPRETRGYVPAFIAATYVMNYYPQHNICPMESPYPVLVDTIMVHKMLHLQQISDILGLPIEEIRSLNPQYKKDIIPGEYKPYPLYLPAKSIAEFIDRQDTIFAYKAQAFLSHRKTVDIADGFASNGKITRTHKVKRGESLGAIARRYGVSVAHIKQLNNLRSNNIVAGKLLVINRATVKKNVTASDSKALASNAASAGQQQESGKPVATPPDSVAETSSGGILANYFKNRIVDSGESPQIADETLPEIAADTTLLLAENADENVAFSREYRNEDDRTIYHKVKIGETLTSIAKRYNVSAVEIVAWNKLSSKKANVGQRLMLKLPEPTSLTESELLAEEEKANNNKLPEAAVTVPPDASKAEPALASNPSAEKASGPKNVVYRVKRGDSLSIIAQKYPKITAEDIMLANNLKSDKLSVGQKLNIPVN